MPTSPSSGPAPAEQPWRRIKPLHILGAVCLVSAAMIVIGTLTRREDPPLTRPDYDAALARWQAKRPASYDLDLYFYSQNAPVDIHLEVRNGQAVALTKNGVRMAQASRREEWTIERLLQQIGDDLRIQEDPNLDFDVKPGVQVKLQAKFDETFGFPTLYSRLAHGSPVQYSYKVKSFTPIE